MDKKKLAVTGALALCCAVLSSCGGGQGAEPPNVTKFNMDAALANALGNGVSFGWMQQSPNVTGAQLALSYEPMTNALLYGQVVRRTSKWSVSVESPPLQTGSVRTVAYTQSPMRIVEELDREGNSRTYFAEGNLPSSAVIGESGPYARTQLFFSTQMLHVDERVEWSLEPDIGDTAWACLFFVPADPSASPQQKECFRIDSAGNIYGFKMVTTSEGQTVTFQSDQLALALPVTGYSVLPTTWIPLAGALFSVIRDETKYDEARQWGIAVLPQAPPVDLSKYMLILIALGAKPDSCWGAELASLTEWPDRTTVRYRQTHTNGGCAQVVTATGLLLSIPTSDKQVQLVEVP